MFLLLFHYKYFLSVWNYGDKSNYKKNLLLDYKLLKPNNKVSFSEKIDV